MGVKKLHPFPKCTNSPVKVSYNYDVLLQEYLPVTLAHTPAGTSVDTLVHYFQLISSG